MGGRQPASPSIQERSRETRFGYHPGLWPAFIEISSGNRPEVLPTKQRVHRFYRLSSDIVKEWHEKGPEKLESSAGPYRIGLSDELPAP